ncbi:inositol monophosphatase [Streptomyces sp. A7024]|uniref:inositol-phosphate phosphatase n=1 Tax=Streptomyces coryli TaxID=1128680 RepID=A0A6G4UD21_9ACTN|nr:inositol monophosphatase family protein [Streptomyces coryli]NGN69101.1 inositol monophosphatase [Streptomyces coryli]
MIEDLVGAGAWDGGAWLDRVEAAVREAVAEAVMPRFRQLAAHEVVEKAGPHDLVTVADREAEELLERSLTALLPGSVLVGEEGVHAEPGRLADVRGAAPVWIVDPVDGTSSFVRGEPDFGCLVALAHRGELLASWTYAPAQVLMATARRGGGARISGAELLRAGHPAGDQDLQVATSHPDYARTGARRVIDGLDVPGVSARPCGSAGLEYLRVATGELDAFVASWESPWDHAAGLLLVAEAGGVNGTVAGEPFRITGGNALPFVTARDADTLRHILGLLTPLAR